MPYKRYKNKILKNSKNERYLSTNLSSYIEKNINDIYIISKRGDRLDIYADKYYGDVTKWTFIARANKIGKGTLFVEPGLQIRIPNNINIIESNDVQLNNK